MNGGAGSVLVAGASGGIGSAVARRLAEDGYALSLLDVREPEVDGTHRFVGDLSDPDVADAWVSEACDRVGPPYGFVNAIGIVPQQGAIGDLPLSAWERTLAVNLSSAYYAARALVPRMRTVGTGRLVFVASVSGLANQEGQTPYSVAKSAMLALVRGLAVDHTRDGIRANAVSPGSVETPLVVRAASEAGSSVEEWAAQYPTARFSRPEEIADVVAFLLSERAENVTGANWVVDGGLTALLPER